MNQFEEPEEIPLTDEIDQSILMHRDAHFGGLFDYMIDYYQKGGKGIHPEFELERIRELALMEREMKKNIAPLLLSGADAEKVAQSRTFYKKLRELYESDKPIHKLPRLVADLILTESDTAQEEIEAIVKEKGEIVPFLIEILRSEELHDPLYPGYGHAPALAMKCLGLIGDKRAIISLFESLGNGDFFDEDVALQALHAIGEPAKKFLLNVLHGKPLNADNETAALALISFKDDPEVSEACFKMLKELDLKKQTSLATYLILACEGLPGEYHSEFKQIANDVNTPKTLKQDFKAVSTSFDS